MIPAVHDIDIYKGDTFSLFARVRAKNPDGSPGAYQDLTGQTPKAQIRASEDSSSVLAEFIATLGNQSTFPGSILLTLTPEVTATLVVNGLWDVQLTDAVGDVRTYLKGAVTIHKDVTRA